LALLMGLSLFTVVGPSAGFLGDLFGTNSSSSLGSVQDDQATKLQVKLKHNPNDANLLAQLVRIRYSAGNAKQQVNATTGQTSLTQAAVAEYAKGADAWQRYLKASGSKKPPANLALLAATSEFYASAAATSVPEFKTHISAAVVAEKAANAARPTLNGYITLNRYAQLAGDKATAAASAAGAKKLAGSANKAAVDQTLQQYVKEGKSIQAQIKKLSKFKPSAQGKQQLQNPLGGLAGGGSGLSGGTTGP
jgi:hypothetical protein